MTYMVKLSPQGQITIPVQIRQYCKHRKYLLELQGSNIILKPLRLFTARDVQKKPNPRPKLTPEEAVIFRIIRQQPCSNEELLAKTKLDFSKLSVLLTHLELKDAITKNNALLWEVNDTFLQ